MTKEHSGLPVGPRPPPRARLADVAEAAGTSKPIASRILNEDPSLSVGKDLRERVKRAAGELRYQPHAGARGLRRATAGAFALLVPEITNLVFATLARGAVARAYERGYVVLMAEDFDERRSATALPLLVSSRRIDGLMIATAREGHPFLADLLATGAPHVFVNRAVPGSGRNIVLDDAAAARMALDHLVEIGHSRVGHISGTADLEPARRRRAAFEARAHERGLTAAPVVEAGLLETGGSAGLRELMKAEPELTAVFASSVMQAAGVLSEAWHLGLVVPRDLSVVAHADTPFAEALIPPVTCVRVPLERLGEIAVDALLEAIGGAAPHDIALADAPELIVRGSTAPPVR